MSSGTRRDFLRWSGAAAALAAGVAGSTAGCSRPGPPSPPGGKPDYTLRIGTGSVELAPGHIVPTLLYNGQFPGPLVRLKEGQRTSIDIYNDTGTPEQLHWHGQHVGVDVDGAAEEGTPDIPAHGMRRISFVPGPPAIASITRTWCHATISRGGSTAGWWAPSTSNPNRIRAATTRKSS
nr:multicopper oxidase domain-containing protein [Mycobacterium gordonae]